MCGRIACTLGPLCLQKALSFTSASSSDIPLEQKVPDISHLHCSTVNGINIAYKPSYNLAPTSVLPVLISSQHLEVKDYKESRSIVPMVWGLIPSWHKGSPLSHGLTTHNCCYETIQTKPMFKKPFTSNKQRCVIVCDGYYEWNKSKQPYFFHASQDVGKNCWEIKENDRVLGNSSWIDKEGWHGPKLLNLAGIFDAWSTPESNQLLYSCSVITIDSVFPVSKVHHRMPCVLANEDLTQWLDPEVSNDVALSLVNKSIDLDVTEVSKYVGNSGNDGIQCVLPITAARDSPMQKWLNTSKEMNIPESSKKSGNVGVKDKLVTASKKIKIQNSKSSQLLKWLKADREDFNK